MSRLRVNRGLSALELAMVTAIIAVVVLAFLLPRFAAARERARVTSCQSNLKQLALAFQMYAYDHNGFFPPGAGEGRPPEEPWLAVFPYVKNEVVYWCPSTKEPEPLLPALGFSGGGGTAPAPPFRCVGYVYVPGHANDDPPDTPLAADDEPRHLGRANVAFLSGEVRWVYPDEWRALGLGQQSER